MKLWFDLCEPKAPIYLKPLYDKLKNQHSILITARDFDSTYALLDSWGVKYYKVGSHGGKDLTEKLHSYINRLDDLLTIVEREKPEFLFSMAAPEATRIAYGIGIPNVMFYDEPRSVGCSKLTLPMAECVIISKYIPFEWYSIFGITEDRVIQFNGIDEVGWLNLHDFTPNVEYLDDLDLHPEDFIVLRPEATQSYSHDSNWLNSDESLLGKLIPKLLKYLEDSGMSKKILLIPRYQDQYYFFLKKFENEIKEKRIILRRSVNHLADIMYYSSLVVSGGGTMVRESALLGVPSVEFIPSETYPQEKFLIENGFPLVHVRNEKDVMRECIAFLENQVSDKDGVREKIDQFDNPIDLGYEYFLKRTKKTK